jgi:hypothetical protein
MNKERRKRRRAGRVDVDEILPEYDFSRDLGCRDLPNADTPVLAAIYYIDDVSVD